MKKNVLCALTALMLLLVCISPVSAASEPDWDNGSSQMSSLCYSLSDGYVYYAVLQELPDGENLRVNYRVSEPITLDSARAHIGEKFEYYFSEAEMIISTLLAVTQDGDDLVLTFSDSGASDTETVPVGSDVYWYVPVRMPMAKDCAYYASMWMGPDWENEDTVSLTYDEFLQCADHGGMYVDLYIAGGAVSAIRVSYLP